MFASGARLRGLSSHRGDAPRLAAVPLLFVTGYFGLI